MGHLRPMRVRAWYNRSVAAVRLSLPLKVGWWVHRSLYALSGGRIGRRSNGFEVLLLTTTGRRTGEPRNVALQSVEHGPGWAVIASYAGENRDPAWRLNLLASPMAEVRVRSVVTHVRARDAAGAERDELWARFVAVDDAYDEYQRRTNRVLPVIVLEPIGR
jgi:deazaflavin-dependent oxidoreductase (nitroreductase family)